MEVRIGVRNVAREVSFESAQTPNEVAALVDEALASSSSTLKLEDEKGRVVVVPVQALGYVEIGAPEKGTVGFGR
ncbi:DUF3107 domain-containing protein [Ornithinimicrobium sp. INDO-MA30-4]|uniref:DUF3107 domain-containing protein n=1 Tax=Ornithinimicrobium sp. INDO-MA30-4 TaxID=2908651 RepID=UPI001F333BA6|nr:DUF3107 domain-containing protein [Ornithinimicrobium sp. INDO-MA30-4]UJH69339.1 DUF3107 domain-containing protein [Ornithinimicrobium sp. INDO-MA30-4]